MDSWLSIIGIYQSPVMNKKAQNANARSTIVHSNQRLSLILVVVFNGYDIVCEFSFELMCFFFANDFAFVGLFD